MPRSTVSIYAFFRFVKHFFKFSFENLRGQDTFARLGKPGRVSEQAAALPPANVRRCKKPAQADTPDALHKTGPRSSPNRRRIRRQKCPAYKIYSRMRENIPHPPPCGTRKHRKTSCTQPQPLSRSRSERGFSGVRNASGTERPADPLTPSRVRNASELRNRRQPFFRSSAKARANRDSWSLASTRSPTGS